MACAYESGNKQRRTIAAVQRRLGHENAVYSVQYARITKEELLGVIDDR